MIASVRGTVAALAPDGVVVEVGGVGLFVSCSPATVASLRPGQPAALATSLVVREDSLTLYGFVDDDDRALFEVLQTATGVGPRLAQAVLAVHSADEVRRAVATEDLPALMLVPGIGRKGAQRIVLDLKDRIGPPNDPGPTGPDAPVLRSVPAWQDQVCDGLVGLGWSRREAEAATATVAEERQRAAGADRSTEAGGLGGPPETADVPVAELLRQALRVLAPGRR